MDAHSDPNSGYAGRALAARLLKEPLLHFLVAGGLLFAAYAVLDRGLDEREGTASRSVHITADEVEWLKQTWTRQWNRAPTEAEVKGLVADHIREELLVREASALGLDENDTVVRRRLAQKMEFLVQDTAGLAEPSEAELRQLYETQPERFHEPACVSFSHVYFSRDRRGARTEADARFALEQLSRAAVSSDEVGDRFLAQREFVDVDAQAVAGVLGPAFARQVFDLDPGAWHGPIESGYGVHLVWVADKQTPHPREFTVVRDELQELWRRQREQEGRAQYFAALLERYDLVVDESVKPLVSGLTVNTALGR